MGLFHQIIKFYPIVIYFYYFDKQMKTSTVLIFISEKNIKSAGTFILKQILDLNR